MSQGNLSGHGIGTSAHKGHRRYCVMRRSERTLRHKHGSTLKLAGNRVYLGGFKSFLEATTEALSTATAWPSSTFRTRSAHKQNVVTAGTRHLKCPLYKLLPLDFREIEVKVGNSLAELLAGIYDRRLNRQQAVEKSITCVRLSTPYTSRLLTTAASVTLALGTIMPLNPASRAFMAIGRAPRIGNTLPSSDSSPLSCIATDGHR